MSTFDEWKLEIVIKGNIIEDLDNSIYMTNNGHPCVNVDRLNHWLRAAYDVGYQAGQEDKEAEFDSRVDIE